MQEEVWQSAEVDALYRLAAAGVRVPQPHICFAGVLLMDLVLERVDQMWVQHRHAQRRCRRRRP